eukprot:UN22014
MMKATHKYDLTIKRCRNHITASFSKMVSPSHLILTDHVTIIFLPIQFSLSSSSTSSFLTNQQMTIFALLKQTHGTTSKKCKCFFGGGGAF